MTFLSRIIAHAFSQLRAKTKKWHPALPKADNELYAKHSHTADAQKSFPEFASRIRATLDATYERIGARPSGSFSDKDCCAVGLDILARRAVFAIASNQDGMFSEFEVSAARKQMDRRQRRAMQAVNPFGLEHRRSAMLKAAIKYLDSAGIEEMASLEWAEAKAAALSAYKAHARSQKPAAKGFNSQDLAA